MFRRLRPLAVLVAGVLVTAIVFGFTPGDEPEAKATLGPLQAVTLSAADFHPYGGGATFYNSGWYLASEAPQLARIPFPAEVVMITSVKARVYDDHGSANLCLGVYRAEPAEGYYSYLGSDCTSGTSTQAPETLTIPAVFTRIGGYHTAYLWATFDGTYDPALQLFGATVFYRVVT